MRIRSVKRKRAIPAASRRAVAIKHGGVPGSTTPAACAYCGAPGKIYWPALTSGKGGPGAWVAFVDLEIDHVVAEAIGGCATIANLVLACRPCNRSKGVKSSPRRRDR